MAKQWTLSYFVANRFGSMCEQTRRYGADLPRLEVERKVENFLKQRRARGEPVYPGYDLQLERVA